MDTITYKKWAGFKEMCERYASLDRKRREQYIFRGHGNSAWTLETTLDRYIRDNNLRDRHDVLEALMRDFKRGSHGLVSLQVNTEQEWELLARHHGLPSPYLDWTQSPYVATFFAFADPEAAKFDTVTIWMLDRDAFSAIPIPEIELIEDYDALRFNSRAIEQRAVFLEVNDVKQPIENLLDNYLYRFDLPSTLGPLVLGDLDSMMINDRTLFRDLDGVARTTAARVSQSGETNG